MGRHRTPTKLLELRGAFRHDPKRAAARLGEPQPTAALGDPPEYFTDQLAAIWHELASLAPAGVLTNMDRWLVELAAQLMLKFRTLGLIPQVGMTGTELGMLVSCLSRMGMTPADRSKVGLNTDRPAERDTLAELAAETRQLHRPN